MKPSDNNIQTINLEQAWRCALWCLAANIPFALWGSVGVGKSTLIKNLTDALKYRLFDVRGSDKEPQDLGGVPFPDGDRVKYLMPYNIPWESQVGDAKGLLFLDEFDRTERATMNVMIQLVLDRAVNGNKLGPNIRVCCAGNGMSDTGTTEITDAMATRVVHLYIESSSESAKDEYEKWGDKNGVTSMMRAFVRTRDKDTDRADKFVELARETPRTRDMADKLLKISSNPKFSLKTSDIMRPVLCGTVGFECGIALMSFHQLFAKCPTVEEIIADPEKVTLPTDEGILYALTINLCDKATGDEDQKRKWAESFAKYFMRWPIEQRQYAFNRLEQKQPSIVMSPVWKKHMQSN